MLFQVVSTGSTCTEKLEAYDWAEDGYFGIANFFKTPGWSL